MASDIEPLVENHRAFLAFLEKRVGSKAEAEDILQEAFVRSVEHKDELRDESSIVAWFYRALRNAVIDRHRRRGTSERALAQLAAEMEDESTPPNEVVETACACVRRLSADLRPEYAKALERVELAGLSMKEFAEEAGITPGNAAVRVHRARAALRERVMKSCGTCAEHGCVDCTCGAS
jgi:RNA polymerase sigma-70 factor (ECF subfamily)